MAYKTGWNYQDLISSVLNAVLKRYPECGVAH